MKISEPYRKAVYRIEVEGKDIGTTLQGRLSSLTLTDNKGFDADQLDIVLDDSDGKLDLPSLGVQMRVAFGWSHSGLIDKGTYTVDQVSHSGAPDIITLRARSADLRSGLTTQRERSWHATTLGAIVREIANENDIDPLIAPALDNLPIDHLDQTNETSANLLTRLAEQFDAIATVKNDKLLFISAGGGVSASGKKLPVAIITRKSGDQHHFDQADRDSYTHVRATYNDTKTGTKSEVLWGREEDDAENNRQAQASVAAQGTYKQIGKISKNRPAAKRLAKETWQAMSKARRAGFVGVEAAYHDRNMNVSGKVAYGLFEEQRARTSSARLAEADAARTGAPVVAIEASADNIKTLRHVYASRDQARRSARAAWRMLQRGMAEFSLTLAEGQPDLIPDQPVTVQGWKAQIDSTEWLISKATHTLNDSGLTTRLEFEIRATEIPG